MRRSLAALGAAAATCALGVSAAPAGASLPNLFPSADSVNLAVAKTQCQLGGGTFSTSSSPLSYACKYGHGVNLTYQAFVLCLTGFHGQFLFTSPGNYQCIYGPTDGED